MIASAETKVLISIEELLIQLLHSKQVAETDEAVTAWASTQSPERQQIMAKLTGPLQSVGPYCESCNPPFTMDEIYVMNPDGTDSKQLTPP